MSRLLRWLTYGALVMELHTWLVQVVDKRMDAELKAMCEAAWRP